MITESQGEQFLRENPLALAYFSLDACGVCHAVQPRLLELAERFSVPVLMISITQQKMFSAQHSVFTAPTILIYHNGREIGRESRFIDFRRITHTLSAVLDLPEVDEPEPDAREDDEQMPAGSQP